MNTMVAMHMQWLVGYVMAGVLLALGFYAPIGWAWALGGLVTFIWATKSAQGLQQHLCGGYITTFFITGAAVGIFFSLYPMDWIEADLGYWELVVIFGKWFITSVCLATSGLVIGLGTYGINRFVTEAWRLLFYPPLWVVGEIFSSFFYSLVVLGPGVSVNIHNSVGYLGYLLIDHNLLKYSALYGGVYMLSFLLVALAGGMVVLYRRSSPRFALLAFVLLCVTAFVPPATTPVVTEGRLVAVIDTAFTTSESYAETEFAAYRKAQIREAVDAALATGADYVVLPEDVRLMGLSDGALAYKLFRFFYQDPEVVLIDSATTPLPSGNQSVVRAFMYDGVAKQSYGIDKQYLTPLGEYVPYSYGRVLTWLGMKNAVEKIGKKLTFVPGPAGDQSQLPAHIPGIVFCFEMVDPLKVWSLTKERPVPFIAYVMSHARFHDSNLLIEHTERMIKTQAIFNQIAIVAAGNMASGAYFTTTGEQIVPEYVAEGERWKVGIVRIP